MADQLGSAARQLLEKPILAHLATTMTDGSPQVTPVWVDTDGEHVLVNTAEGRLKTRNMRRDKRVSISFSRPGGPVRRRPAVRGTVVELTMDGADDYINTLAKKYLGADEYPNRQPGEVRLIVTILPDRVTGGAAGS